MSSIIDDKNKTWIFLLLLEIERYDGLGRLINTNQIGEVYQTYGPRASIKTNKTIDYYTNTRLPKTISYNSTPTTSDGDTNAKFVYENSYVDGNITKMKETETRFCEPDIDDYEVLTTSFESKTTKFMYDDSNRIIKEERPNGDIFDYIYDDKSNMVSTIKKNNTIIQSFSFEDGKRKHFPI